MGAKIISEACRKGFFVGFERCKLMVLAYLFNLGTELPRVDPLDESPKAMVDDHVKIFIKSLE